jgi:hypothetical protein
MTAARPRRRAEQPQAAPFPRRGAVHSVARLAGNRKPALNLRLKASFRPPCCVHSTAPGLHTPAASASRGMVAAMQAITAPALAGSVSCRYAPQTEGAADGGCGAAGRRGGTDGDSAFPGNGTARQITMGERRARKVPESTYSRMQGSRRRERARTPRRQAPSIWAQTFQIGSVELPSEAAQPGGSR